MAVTYVGSNKGTDTSDSSTVTTPTGTNGDELLVIGQCWPRNGSATTPDPIIDGNATTQAEFADIAQIIGPNAGNGDRSSSDCDQQTTGAGTDASYTISLNQLDNSYGGIQVLLRLSACQLQTTNGGVWTFTGTTHTVPAHTVDTDGSMAVLLIAGWGSAPNNTTITGQGYTSRQDGDGGWLRVYTKAVNAGSPSQFTAGTDGNSTSTLLMIFEPVGGAEQIEASLSGSATGTAVGSQVGQIAANLSGSATATATGNHTVPVAASLSASATGTAVGVDKVPIAASLTADLTAAGVGAATHTLAASLSGSAAGTAVGAATYQLAAALTADATGTATGAHTAQIAASLTADLAATAVGSAATQIAANLTADATGTAVGAATHQLAGSLTADATGTAVGAATHQITASLTGDATGTAVGLQVGQVAAALTADLTGTAVGSEVHQLAASLDGQLTATATGSVTTSTMAQEGYRFGADDGTEATHTWLAAQDTPVTGIDDAQTFLLRVLVDISSGPAKSSGYKLWVKPSADPDTSYREVRAT